MIIAVFILNLCLTIIVEGLIIALLFRKGKFVYYSVLCNILTNPALNLILLFVIKSGGAEYYNTILFVLEVVVVLVEAYVLKILCEFSNIKFLLISVLMNFASFITGILIYKPY